ncbi:hypothetical protein CRM22_010481 [Opisthorchis felineus]|uniref:Cytochrome b561 domain-containing protein n=1 Tax=Opisthorchis felineus TaxID=147828 RepID=A0A4S2KYJ1_OPIFE|nr:hypothetical protein CRM22_010481 [Opisthorchis felineus]
MFKKAETVIFWTAVVLSQVFGVICVVLAGFWGGAYGSGFDWNDPSKVFNFHILFMTLGFVFLFGDALLVYRLFRSGPKRPLKILHAFFLILALVCAAVGVRAVYEVRKDKPPKTLYSIHSWLGITLFVGFALQWLFGFILFLFPKTPMYFRKICLPFHTGFGLFLHCLAVLVALCGITEKNMFSGRYKELQSEEVIGNLLGLFTVGFHALVFFIVSYSAYRRVEPEELENDAGRSLVMTPNSFEKS